MKPRYSDYLATTLLKILPQRGLAKIMYWLTRSRFPPLKNFLIHYVVDRYRVNLFEAKNPNASDYACFNDFFTRPLRPDARFICSGNDELASPVDGTLSQFGSIVDGRLIQAKNHDYRLQDLLAGDKKLAEEFLGGDFATSYLSPRDYHRIHMPMDGVLREMLFVPGKLFSVSEATAQIVDNLFAINERTICIFDTTLGPMAVILVGAIFVGSMETVWEGVVKGRRNAITRWRYAGKKHIPLQKGVEMGRFNMGSTVILLFPKNRIRWDDSLTTGATTRVGERIARIPQPASED